MRHNIYGINEGSWANITSLYSYMFHYNYLFDIAVDLEVLYPIDIFGREIFADDNLMFLHWEQEETWLEQAAYINTLFLNKPPHDNRMFFRKAASYEEYEEYKRHRYSYHCKLIKNTKGIEKDLTDENKWAMVWPMKNNFQRVENKVAVSIPSENIGMDRLERNYDWNVWLSNIQKNYDVVAIDYRMPIREVIYHLSTAKFYFCATSGMAQQFSVGLGTPTLIMGGFKDNSSGTEQLEQFIPKEHFDRVGDKSYIEDNVAIAKDTLDTLIPSLELIGAF